MMRKIIIILITVFIYLSLYSQEDNTARNFFDLCLMGGVSLTSAGDFCGGGAGFNIGYCYLFSDCFALGPGASAYFGFPHFTAQTGGALLLKLMAGPIKKKKTAFLLDIGGGWIFQVSAGFNIKGFVFRTGYMLTCFGAVHTIIMDAGYKFHWNQKNNKFQK